MDRRGFLGATARLAALAALGQLGACTQSQPFKFDRDPFPLGVASGDPLPDGVVLWTRLAPDPLTGGGMGTAPVDVEWLVSRDEAMKDVVRSGTSAAAPDLAHSVHVEVAGLEPDRVYWYRFRAGGAESPVGRTRTAPAAGTVPDALRFAFASCQNYTQGYYTAHANLAREDLDAVLFLGDYIYEGTARGHIVRDYRRRHRQGRSSQQSRARRAGRGLSGVLRAHARTDSAAAGSRPQALPEPELRPARDVLRPRHAPVPLS